MNDLSKQQLILLALLVSFVTSLATGIVTVSLMDQAPDGTTRTVSQVIERTIEQMSPGTTAGAGNAAAVAVTEDPSTAAAAIERSLVRFVSGASDDVSGLGVVMNSGGVILTDKSVIAGLTGYTAILSDGSRLPVVTVRSQDNGDVVFLAPARGAAILPATTPAHIGDLPALAEHVYSLSGTSTLVLGEGIVTVQVSTSSSLISTDIPSDKVLAGSPLFDIHGHLIGLATSALEGKNGAEFYPISLLAGVIPDSK
ncbi:MAG: trypsin-like peptidase domain-containing protein [Patescibacteria group bacterium]|nr:trypsin-like peptidase domain-containing protein [Patescibacteria group bacterium]MDE2172604.1 trypsin-like peptidase domain-containing protein [Patescibacteria group bacterium]